MFDLQSEILKFDDSQDITNAWTPPSSWYTQNEFLNLEHEKVFLKNWMFVDFTYNLSNEGDYSTGKVANRPYVLLKNKDHIKAYYNICSHHGTCVAKGKGNTESLVCPYHGWVYNLEGKLKKIPKAGSITDIHKKGMNLKEIPMHISGPFVFLWIGDGDTADFSESLEEHFSRDLYQNLNFVKRTEYIINCNWKVFVDNYLDGGYHVPHMHPGLTTQLDLDSYYTDIHDNWSLQKCLAKTSEAKDKEVKGRVSGEAEYTWAYPNFMINRYGKWMDTNWAIPMGPNKSKIVFDYFYDGNPKDVEMSLDASDKVQAEDMEICDMVQDGLNSGVYKQGVYAPQFEKPMFHFHQLLKESFLTN
ncbi:MAG: aromatic ring-hydroxylating dioxygenase subunit alpha [Bacteriovoracaceae bacterium]|nr:aromatic ring-hydroxylating dioxygenase subunit alpha [Bacteriovoracaceae bacterium]